ncbi:hypothetical protein KC323_g3161 [Hortaea werneckii]|uniref:RBR-type E3 ubiquitin transferase n=1 Tax=Hortaea werneckii TaxID=91943 RepID=A0A3M7HY92_HORWE|nr:hypothetical protein KC323_g3161 [Hortaea werneckii]KAI7357806.1 hypothetical protein KC320_g1496 [Hortaea werneckii]RMZ18217.1 hypothetical protein D0862_00494 [Hortaea werneckii]
MATPEEDQPPPTPRCVVCDDTGDEYPLIQPCRLCRSDYCLLCLAGMFYAAATFSGRMPPRCCTLLQIHTALPLLDAQDADTYRAKLEEFLTPDKVYCPAPRCSAFIPPRFITLGPTSPPSSPGPISQQEYKPTALRAFSCPKCHVAICTKCKQIEHGTQPCDTTRRDEELAMLKQFGLKQCPNCKQAIRKMFGCSHIQCRCGAHFCYHCQLSVRDCDGSCDRYDEEFGGQDSDAATATEASQESQVQSQQQQQAEGYGDADINVDIQVARDGIAPNLTTNRPTEAIPESETKGDPHHGLQSQHAGQHDSTGSEMAPVNLDGGGSVRWEDSGLDFGSEPDDNTAYHQIWSCLHDFVEYLPIEDGANHGREDLMECNRCFQLVAPSKLPETHIGGFKVTPGAVEDYIIKVDDRAWECLMCRLVTCTRCKEILE